MASKRTTSISAFRMSVASALKTRSTKEKLLRVAVEIAELDRHDKVNTAGINVGFHGSNQTADAMQAIPAPLVVSRLFGRAVCYLQAK